MDNLARGYFISFRRFRLMADKTLDKPVCIFFCKIFAVLLKLESTSSIENLAS